MLHKFVSSTRTILYDPEINGLFDEQMHPINDHVSAMENAERWRSTYGSREKSNTPSTIKISLGQACNYSCGYCLQKDIGDPSERPQNGLTPQLIANIRRHLDLTQLTRFELWGGETLLYWKDMVALMTEFDHEGISWYVPTNGTPLHHKHVDFFMTLKGKITIGISHDGPAHESTRGVEFLHKKVGIFRRIQEKCSDKIQFGFNPVISNTNFDLFEIDRFFSSFLQNAGLRPVGLSFELGRTYDKTLSVNSSEHVIQGSNIQEYREILRAYLRAHIDQFMGKRPTTLLPTNLFHLGVGALELALSLRNATPSIVKTNCGADDKTQITLDMLGNVRTCQNVDAQYNAGQVMALKGIRIKNINLERDGHCGGCHVRRLCKSSCPIDTGDAFYLNCTIEKRHYTELLLGALALIYGEEFELML